VSYKRRPITVRDLARAAHESGGTLRVRFERPTMSHAELSRSLDQLNACSDAREWVAARPDRTPAELWTTCERGDWLLWLAGRVGVERRTVVLAACDCAEPALRYVPEGEERPRRALEITRAWCRGEATIEEVRAAAADAEFAYAASAYAASAAESSTAAYAASAAAAAANAESAATSAARAGDDAEGARRPSLSASAGFARARITWAMVEEALP